MITYTHTHTHTHFLNPNISFQNKNKTKQNNYHLLRNKHISKFKFDIPNNHQAGIEVRASLFVFVSPRHQ